MKFKSIIPIFFATVAFTACDKVDLPLQTGNTGGGNNGGSADVVTQKVLIEDFTGQGCGNCPGAAVTATQLKNLYGDKLIIISTHAGWFANGGNPWASNSDLSCTVSEELNTAFGNDVAGNPNGFVNRKEVNGAQIVQPSAWGSATQDIFDNQTPAVDIDINNPSYSGGNISVDIEIEYQEDLNGNYNLVVAVTEDEITDWQKNYAGTGDPSYPVGDVDNYIHHHVLRGHMNGTWGTSVLTGQTTAGTIDTHNFSMPKGASWNDSKLSIVAYLYNTATNEIVNVEEGHVGN